MVAVGAFGCAFEVLWWSLVSEFWGRVFFGFGGLVEGGIRFLGFATVVMFDFFLAWIWFLRVGFQGRLEGVGEIGSWEG